MFLRQHGRIKDGKQHSYWSLVETVRTADGPRQRTLCYLGELNGSAHARWQKTVEVFNEHGETTQLKLFPSEAEAPDDPNVACVLVKKVRGCGPAAELIPELMLSADGVAPASAGVPFDEGDCVPLSESTSASAPPVAFFAEPADTGRLGFRVAPRITRGGPLTPCEPELPPSKTEGADSEKACAIQPRESAHHSVGPEYTAHHIYCNAPSNRMAYRRCAERALLGISAHHSEARPDAFRLLSPHPAVS
jgi:hypothetical protein